SEAAGGDTDIYVTDDNIFAGLCDTQTPQGILCVMRMPEREPDYSPGKKYVYCDRITDPGNLGTIIRTADAGGIDGILLSPGCVDLYSPKTVRSSMGSFFHIPVRENVTIRELAVFSEKGYRILSAVLGENAIDYRSADYSGSVIIALGNEANGICEELKQITSQFIKIPVLGKAESLNVSIAGAILIYEIVRNTQK
ncbi:MAG: RNA methyltransferase, partial [Oscillospiraceae bacterium]|nr:RNA methyltransferase [Oscillospiraceae bacterium]